MVLAALLSVTSCGQTTASATGNTGHAIYGKRAVELANAAVAVYNSKALNLSTLEGYKLAAPQITNNAGVFTIQVNKATPTATITNKSLQNARDLVYTIANNTVTHVMIPGAGITDANAEGEQEKLETYILRSKHADELFAAIAKGDINENNVNTKVRFADSGNDDAGFNIFKSGHVALNNFLKGAIETAKLKEAIDKFATNETGGINATTGAWDEKAESITAVGTLN